MINRQAKSKLAELGRKYKAVAITGPRQSGKTTLVKLVFKGKPYVSLENPDVRKYALEDPRGFLQSYPDGAVLDEVQRAPELFSYIQEILDNSKAKGYFILTGSNNFLLQQTISQTLAGRIAYFNLLPFSIEELDKAKKLMRSDEKLMLKGFYPPVYDQKLNASEWSANYIKTYIERDVRQIKNITDLIVFERFISLLAGRNAQELNSNALSVETGVDLKTIQAWIGILESSYVIYLLKPHHKNFNKTIVKRPKVYFYDCALVCSLLGITNEIQLKNHPLRGSIFESMVITELIKKRTHKGLPVNLYFWRDKTGHEIDVVIDTAGKLMPVEIKAGKTINSEFLKNLIYWKKISGESKSMILYAGLLSQKRNNGVEIINWRSVAKREL